MKELLRMFTEADGYLIQIYVIDDVMIETDAA